MSSRPRPKKCTVGAGVDALVLYVDPPRLQPYLGSITPDAAEYGEDVTQSVSSHTRRRYSGGPAVTVDAHSRDRKVGGYGALPTLPGRNAWIEKKTGQGASAVREVVQFTFVGTTKQLRDFVAGNATSSFVLRTPDGEPVPVTSD